MFSCEVTKEFRSSTSDTSMTLQEYTNKAWVSFLYDFCPLVSYEWNDYLKNVIHTDTASFFGNLTTSDEAFTQWVILCKFDEVRKEAEEIDNLGKETWYEKRKKRKRGPHDSREKMELYSNIYQSIVRHRSDRNEYHKWQHFFFENFLKDKEKLNNDAENTEHEKMIQCALFQMPSIDGELDGFGDEEIDFVSV